MMNKTSKFLIMLIMVSAIFGCQKDDDPKPDDGAFKIEGIIVTDKTIASDNTIKALIEDFGDDEGTDEEHLVGSSKIKGKSFSIPVENPDSYLTATSVDELRTDTGDYLIQLECKKNTIKGGLIYSLPTLNTGTSIVNLDRVILCTPKTVTGKDSEGYTEWLALHSIHYFYSDVDFIFHKSKEKTEDLKPGQTPSIYKLNVKKVGIL